MSDLVQRLRAELAITKRDALEAKQDVRDLLGLKVERDALRAERDALQLQIGELNDALGVIDHCQIKPLVDALRADAERYWWLRSHYDPAIWDLQGENEKLDAALDAARKQDD